MTVTSWQSVFRTQNVTESTIASVLPVTKETGTLNLSLETLLSFKLTVLFHLALMDLKAAQILTSVKKIAITVWLSPVLTSQEAFTVPLILTQKASVTPASMNVTLMLYALFLRVIVVMIAFAKLDSKVTETHSGQETTDSSIQLRWVREVTKKVVGISMSAKRTLITVSRIFKSVTTYMLIKENIYVWISLALLSSPVLIITTCAQWAILATVKILRHFILASITMSVLWELMNVLFIKIAIISPEHTNVQAWQILTMSVPRSTPVLIVLTV